MNRNDKAPMNINTKLCHLVIALLPCLGMIRSPIPHVDLGTTIILLLYLGNVCLTGKLQSKRSSYDGIFYFILIVTPIAVFFQFLIANDLNAPFLTIFMRWGKMFVSLFILFKSGIFDHLSSKHLMKFIKYISCISSILVIIQSLTYSILGIILQNPLLSFATYDGYTSNYTNISGALYRPSAIFFEPSHMAVYVLLYICYQLFTKEKKGRGNYVVLAICTIGLILTGSGLGILGAFSLYIIKIFILIKKNIIIAFIFATALVFIIMLTLGMEHVQLALARIFSSNTSGGGNAVVGRIGIGYSLFWEADIISKLIGNGIGNVLSDIYLNGWAYILNTMGFAGFLVVIKKILRNIKTKITWQRIASLMYCGMLIGAQLFTVPVFALYIFAIDDKYEEKNPSA